MCDCDLLCFSCSETQSMLLSELNPLVVTCYETQSSCCHIFWNSIHVLSHTMELNPFVVTCYGTQSSCCHIFWNSIHVLSHTMELNPFVVTCYGTQSICYHMLKSHMHLAQYSDQVCIRCGSVKVTLCPLTSSVDRVCTCTTPSTHISVDLVIVL